MFDIILPLKDDSMSYRSPPINVEDIGSTHLRLRAPGDSPENIHLIRGDIQIDGSTIFITFSTSDEWPFLIENQSDYALTLCQEVRIKLLTCLTS